jgi:CRISPR type III-B/RAMP module RAMP protein Cmr1
MLCKKPLEFEVVTPLYLGGADPRAPGDARIYVRPIVAHWRWWFRALAGGILGTTPKALDKLRAAEQACFGGVHEAGQASSGPMRFRVRLIGQKLGQPVQYLAQRDPVLGYLGYGLGATRTEQPRWAIPPEARFRIEVITTEPVWKILTILNYFWVNFGGLGARSRRGLGSLEWLDGRCNPTPQNGQRAAELRESFRSALGELAPTRGEQPEFLGGLPEMAVVHPQFFRAKVITKPFDRWRDALTAIRNQLRLEVGSTPPPPQFHLGRDGFGYRQGDGQAHRWQPEYKQQFPYYPTRDKAAAWSLHRALRAGRQPHPPVSLVNPRFGLPLVFSGWSLTITARHRDEELRRPSPVSFRVFRDQNKYRIMVVYWKSRFLPEQASLLAVWRRNDQQHDCEVRLAQGWEYLDRFFEFCDGEEVML